MTPTLTFNGRLPGVLCNAALPPPAPAPLRLDVAGFVGFAERGPLNTPVAVEDISQYEAVFGRDLAVAREGGQPVYAYLRGAVQAFFDNGGRRCHVVRVAGDGARANRFLLPGLVSWSESGGVAPVVVAAAWAGRWSDAVSLETRLRALPLWVSEYRPTGNASGTAETDLELPSLTTLVPGDLLRLHLGGGEGTQLFFRVARLRVRGAAVTTTRGVPVTVEAEPETLLAFATLESDPLPPPQAVDRLGAAGWEPVAAMGATLERLALEEGQGYALTLPAEATVRAGDLLRLTDVGDEVRYFRVDQLGWQEEPGSPPEPVQRATGQTLLRPTTLPTDDLVPVQADRLRFDLFVREGEETQESWVELRFGKPVPAVAPVATQASLPSAPRSFYWAEAFAQRPADAESLTPDAATATVGEIIAVSTRVRAPASATLVPAPLFLPLGMSELPVPPDQYARPLPEPGAGSPPDTLPGQDGLDRFDPVGLFLDPVLADVGTRSLMAEAEYRLYLSPTPQALLRLHSLLPLDEIGLIALPDLVHRPWGPPQPLSPEPVPEPEPEPEPDWSRFRDCVVPVPPPPPPPGLPEHAPCDVPFAWSAPEAAPEPTDVRLQLASLPVLDPPEAYDAAPLLAVQTALVTLCAARADALALLSLPRHVGEREALEWQQRFTGQPAFRDGDPLSYAAVYHPWPLVREEVTPELAPLRAIPPEGAVGGLIAARELARGVWVAPANEPLRSVVALTPELDEATWGALFDAHFNVIRQRPGRFTLLSAHTLSADRQLLQISVRRLLIFLRKLALRRGMRYVFETNNARFRQRVQLAFEGTLNTLLTRGALSAFQVVTGSEINTPNDVENGRFLIALKVAPTLPIEWITVTLLRAGEGLLEVVEG